MKDYVKCCNCEFEGTVKLGERVCPECKKEGCLSWVEGMPQEVNNDFQKGEKQ